MNIKFLGILLITGVIFLVLILNQKWYQPKPSATQVPQAVTEEADQDIKVLPLNVTQFEKSLVSDDACGNPVGMITYHDKSSDSWMKINSTTLPGNPDSKKGLTELQKLLDNGQQEEFQNLGSIEMAFRDYCGGHYIFSIRELTGIKYERMDQSRAFMTLTGQASGGDITVYVFAKKRDNYIQLVKTIQEEGLYKNYIKSCELEAGGPIDEDCYRKAIINDKNLEQIARNQANQLVSSFAIQ